MSCRLPLVRFVERLEPWCLPLGSIGACLESWRLPLTRVSECLDSWRPVINKVLFSIGVGLPGKASRVLGRRELVGAGERAGQDHSHERPRSQGGAAASRQSRGPGGRLRMALQRPLLMITCRGVTFWTMGEGWEFF